MARKAGGIGDWIRRYLAEEQPRSKSLIVSVFGDSIAPGARGLWLGELIALLKPFGLSERLVRTSMFRLVEEGWLEARREGRRSYYALTDSGVRRVEMAYERIYTPPQAGWDGVWTLVILPSNTDAAPRRAELRRELEWEGFAAPTPGLMLHPAANPATLRSILHDTGLAGRAPVFQSRAFDGLDTEPVGELIARCWDLGSVGAGYRHFIERFEQLRAVLQDAGVTPEQRFTVQTLLIHSFRRVTLHDPRIPVTLLPPDWPGLTAYHLCREIYRLTHEPAEAHVRARLEAGGTQPAAPASVAFHSVVKQRFGGLDEA
ncbi:MAG: phenylacetic acid degradation operon negative regulatory protein PaaX [Panacagrimonas sp.]